MTPQEALRLLDTRPLEESRAAVRGWLREQGEGAAPAMGWAEVCERLGLGEEAEAQYRRALREGAPREVAWEGLARLARSQGDVTAELRCRERRQREAPDEDNAAQVIALTQALAAPLADAAPEGEEGASGEPDSADLSRFLHLFTGREGVHARQWWSPGQGGGYSPVERPLTAALLRAHLRGEQTLGTYVVRVDQTATFSVLDLDLTKRALEQVGGQPEGMRGLKARLHREGLRLRAALEALGLRPLLADSGYKGRHLWLFWERPVSAALLCRLGRRLARALGPVDEAMALELFPKQAEVREGGLGNLIKWPLGVHRRSGRRAGLLGEDGRPLSDPWAALRALRPHSAEELEALLERLRDADQAREAEALPGPGPRWPPSPWTQASFQTNPEVATLLRGCGVLEALVRQAQQERRLGHEAQVVLRHTLGHLPEGVLAVNYLLERCPEVEPKARLQSPLRGNPISCAKIRRQVPEVSCRVGCHCAFTVREDHYPTPLLHLDEARARGGLRAHPLAAELREAEAAPLTPEERSRQVLLLTETRARVTRELEEARAALSAAVRGLPGQALEVDGGRWFWDGDDASLRWETSTASDGGGDGGGEGE